MGPGSSCNVSRVTCHVSAAGEVKDPSGLTIEGLQEFYDEACLAVLNNKYQDGIQWHDVPCYFRWVDSCHIMESYQRTNERTKKGLFY